MPENDDVRSGDEPDPFDGLVLNEDFVKGATAFEPPARTRAAIARFGSADDSGSRGSTRRGRPRRPRTARTARRPWLRRNRSPYSRWRAAGLVPKRRSENRVVVVVIGVSLLAGTAFLLPDYLNSRNSRNSGTTLQAAGGGGSGAPQGDVTGTRDEQTPELLRLEWTPHRCYTWDQGDPQTSVEDVPCAGPHLFEAVGHQELGSAYSAASSYPTPAEWGSIADRHCAALITSYLGYSLDPAGRFAASTIHPLPTGWDSGDRHVVCGLSVRSSADGVLMPEFTGQVHGADQTWVFPAGTCFRRDEQGLQQEVNCDQPHIAQSVGSATLTGPPGSEPPSPSEFERMATAACAPLHAPYLRHSRFGGAKVTAGWHLIRAESWRAGTRSTTCTVGFTDAAGQPKEVAGLLSPGATTPPGTIAT